MPLFSRSNILYAALHLLVWCSIYIAPSACQSSRRLPADETVRETYKTPCSDRWIGNCDSLNIVAMECLNIDSVSYTTTGNPLLIYISLLDSTCLDQAYCEQSTLWSYMPYSCLSRGDASAFWATLEQINREQWDLSMKNWMPYRVTLIDGLYTKEIRVISKDSIAHIYGVLDIGK